jgi:hypothetical protein
MFLPSAEMQENQTTDAIDEINANAVCEIMHVIGELAALPLPSLSSAEVFAHDRLSISKIQRTAGNEAIDSQYSMRDHNSM